MYTFLQLPPPLHISLHISNVLVQAAYEQKCISHSSGLEVQYQGASLVGFW